MKALAALRFALLCVVLASVARAEERVALVIGNAAYKVNPLDNPVNDARLVARALREARFEVRLHENLDRRGLVEAIREFGRRLDERSIALLYYAGHGLQLKDRNFLVPIDAEIHREEEIPLMAIDVGLVLDTMTRARSPVNLLVLDACRNNPFVGGARATTQGLAAMDAPVGTLIAFATRPGHLAVDGAGPNGVYAAHLAREMVTPDLPIEEVFRNVRNGVVRDTNKAQIPMEYTSLVGDFAFVRRSTEAPKVAMVAPPPSTERATLAPRVGDIWRYRVQDQFRIGDLFVTTRVDEVREGEIAETWSASSGARAAGQVSARDRPRFHLPAGWDLTPPEFAPYLLAGGALRVGQRFDGIERRVNGASVMLSGTVEAEEEIAVPAGRFRAYRVVLRGASGPARGASSMRAEYVAWYAPQVKRLVRTKVTTHMGGSPHESTTLDLIEYKLN